MPRFIVMVKATKESEAGVMPTELLLAEMGKYNEELVKAGVMLAGEGLHPSSKGARVKFGVPPESIADYHALVGDSADGYPGIPGCGAKTAARMIERFQHIELFPPEVLQEKQELALLFKTLATLRTDAKLFRNVDQLRWRGPAKDFAEVAERVGDPKLATRVGVLTSGSARQPTISAG